MGRSGKSASSRPASPKEPLGTSAPVRPVSLKDIASRLGISIATVSRALQGSTAVSNATRERVMEAAREMRYSKNFIADSLRSGTLPVVGVIVPHGVTLFYSSVLDGIESVAAREGYAVISMNSHESYEEECRNVRSLAAFHVAGVIASVTQETEDCSHFDALAAEGIPVVFVARAIGGGQSKREGTDYSSVTADSVAAARRATLHLVRQGCRRIAILCGPGRLRMVAERKHGYIEALHEAGLPVRPDYVAYSAIDTASAIDVTDALMDLPEPPDAILALNDTLLFAAMKALRRRGLDMPRDVALIGFSDVEYAADVSPSLSTIEDRSRLMGEEACLTLLGHLRGNAKPIHKVIPTVQRIRESSRRKME
ncbi:MAG: LacI family transcriptional regulator [Prevotella sp.]|nr:LacI family transcriptional regulator [Prevotella sp.]